MSDPMKDIVWEVHRHPDEFDGDFAIVVLEARLKYCGRWYTWRQSWADHHALKLIESGRDGWLYLEHVVREGTRKLLDRAMGVEW